MTPFGASVGRELHSALVPLETVSIIDHRFLDATLRALLNNALFYVVPTERITAARREANRRAEALAEAIREEGIRAQGISLPVDRARADAIFALEALIDAVADAEPTPAARYLGIA